MSRADQADKVVVPSPALVGRRLDVALERFLRDYPDIPRAKAITMWKAEGG